MNDTVTRRSTDIYKDWPLLNQVLVVAWDISDFTFDYERVKAHFSFIESNICLHELLNVSDDEGILFMLSDIIEITRENLAELQNRSVSDPECYPPEYIHECFTNFESAVTAFEHSEEYGDWYRDYT